MCSEFRTATSPKQIEQALGIPILNNTGDFDWGKTVRLHTNAPAIRQIEPRVYDMSQLIFPSSPFPNARLSRLEGQSEGGDDKTINDETQIERIYRTKTWGTGFAHAPVIVPAKEFTEFPYWGEQKGTVQGFQIPGEELMYIAALGIRPYVPSGKSGEAFSLITHTATDQMLKYHHRLIVVFKAAEAIAYLDPMTPQERFDFILANRYRGPLNIKKIRNRPKGWEKKVEIQERKLKNELAYRQVLTQNGVEG